MSSEEQNLMHLFALHMPTQGGGAPPEPEHSAVGTFQQLNAFMEALQQMTPNLNLSKSSNSSACSTDSGFSGSPSSYPFRNITNFTPCTSRNDPAPIRRKFRKDFCKVCNKNIFRENARSQGPRRHIMQHHMQRAIFKCPLCPFSSNYDKAHVHAHLRRMHPREKVNCVELERSEYAREEFLWMEACFGGASNGEIPDELLKLQREQTKKEDQRKRNLYVKEDAIEFKEETNQMKEEPDEEGEEEVEVHAAAEEASHSTVPLNFSIENILTKQDSPSVQDEEPVLAPVPDQILPEDYQRLHLYFLSLMSPNLVPGSFGFQ